MSLSTEEVKKTSVEGNKKMKLVKESKHFIVAVIIFAIISLILPAANGLTQKGVFTLAFMVGIIYLWLTVDVGWSSFLGIAGICLIGALDSPNAVFQASIGHMTVIFAVAVIILNNAMAEAGITKHIAYWFLTRKIAKNRPWMFITMFLLSAWVIGLFMDQSALMIIYLAFIDSIHKAIGYEKGEKFGKVITFGSLACICSAYFATPFAHVVPVIMLGMIASATGVSVSVLKYISVGIPFSFCFFLCVLLVSKFVIRPDVEKLKNYDAQKARADLEPVSREGKIIVVTFIIVIFFWIFPDAFKSVLPAAAGYVKAMGIAVPTILGVVALCVIKHKGTKHTILNYYKAINGVPWGVMIFLGTIMLFTTVITAKSTGINVFLSNVFAPMTSTLSPFALIAVAFLGTVVLTNFISNSVSQTLFFTLLAPVFLQHPEYAVSVVAYGIMLTFMANTAICTPPATGPTPYVYSSGYVEIKDGFKYGGILVICAWVLSLLFWPLLNSVF